MVDGNKVASKLGRIAAEKATSELKKENDKAWGTFKRSLLPPAGSRPSKTPRCPDHMAQKIRSADPKTVQEWFALHRQNDGDWAQVEIAIRAKETQQNTDLTGDAYKTRADMLVMHNGNVDVVDRIIAAKEAAGAWIPHPDLPEERDLRLYEVFDYKKKERAKTNEASKESTMHTSLSSSGADSLAAVMPSGPSSAQPALTEAESTLQDEF